MPSNIPFYPLAERAKPPKGEWKKSLSTIQDTLVGSPLCPHSGAKPVVGPVRQSLGDGGIQRATFSRICSCVSVKRRSALHRSAATILIACALVLCSLATSHSHEVQRNCSFTVIDTTENKLQWTITFNIYDLNRFFKLDTDTNHFISFAEMRAAMPRITQELQKNLKLTVDGKEVAVKEYPHLFLDAHRDLIMQNAYVAATLALAGEAHYTEADSLMAQLNFVFGADISKRPTQISLDVNHLFTLDVDHRHMAIIDFLGETALLFDKTSPTQSFALTGNNTFERTDSTTTSVYLRFLKYGIEHILIGYDHILFLLGLLLVSLNMRELIKIVTSFTIAHSITLTLAALKVIQLPSRLIEIAIALTIIYVAVENFYIKSSKHRWKLTFGFGLIHGFGFANVLHELGLPGKGLAIVLFNFNLGVEIGQLLIVLVTAPIFLIFSKSAMYPKFVKIASGVIGLFGLIWFIQRATGYTLIPI